MSEKAIKVENLEKRFRKVKAVDGITFSVDYGELFALLGPNGAGKSTTIRILTTLAYPTGGRAEVAGYDVKKQGKEVRKKIGLVSDRLILYDRLTALENIQFFSRLYGVDDKTIMKRSEELLSLLGMWKWKDTFVSKMSTGMKQKINIARALIPEPEIIFLDEPTLGLDPESTMHIRNFIFQLSKKGKTIILTTHILHEVELLAGKVAIMNKGKIVAIDTPRNLKKHFKEKEVIEVELERTIDKELIKGKIVEAIDNYFKVEVEDLNSFLKELADLNVKVKSIKTMEPSLEDIFVKLTTGAEVKA
ncbi:ABC transporter ATP-binding protein [Mesoaciditoga lauensis]|uniref:ABC transporter ATP-binding protein n=1 Tax=Mesoaciditoga lauensis TaxID=1495039 RepID=UPI0005639ABE|nr:ABC transporter ATP-binding protein [Mesoaciditoga lauensis]